MSELRAQIATEIDAVFAMSDEEIERRITAAAAHARAPSSYDRPFSARVELCACRRLFEWADGSLPEATKPGFGLRALCLPVRDRDGVIVDTVAWNPADPYEWWVREDAGRWLGLDHAAREMWSLDDRRGIDLLETPSQWVKAGGRGLVVLDWQLGEADLDMLDSFHQLRFASRELGQKFLEARRAVLKPQWEMVVVPPGASPAIRVPAHAG